MISELLPGCVVCVERTGDPDPAPLFPEEEPIVARAVEKRRREFALGRQCAREALSAIGAAPVPILPGPQRQPLWPAGIVGSITHCAGFCAAAVARRDDIAGVGIDAENYRPLEPGVIERITLPVERDWIAAQPAGGIRWEFVFFSAKESVYKAWFPLMGKWLGFEDVRIEFDLPAASFTAYLSADGPKVLRGRFTTTLQRALTAVIIPARVTAGEELPDDHTI
jgi:4'-phosphopantetheinyl transferase EntD